LNVKDVIGKAFCSLVACKQLEETYYCQVHTGFLQAAKNGSERK